MAQERIELLRSDRGGCQRHIHANGSGGAHGVGCVTDKHQAIARPVFDQHDLSFKWKKWFEVVEIGGEISEDRIKALHPLSYCRNTGLPPALPLTRREYESGLNMVRILRQHEPLHV